MWVLVSLWCLWHFLLSCFLVTILYCSDIVWSKDISFLVCFSIGWFVFPKMVISSLNLMVFQFLYNLLSVLLWNYYFYLIETKLLKESNKYGSYNTCTSGSTLSRVALNFPLSREQMEKECMRLVKPLGILVFCYSFVAINEIILF